MKKYFTQLPLSRKLLLIAVVPLICLIYFCILVFDKQNENIRSIDYLQQQVKYSDNVMAVADAIHLERRYSMNFILGSGSKEDMLVHRAKTDMAIEGVKNNLLTPGSRFLQYSMLNTLPVKRKRIDLHEIKEQDVLTYYSDIIFRLNNMARVDTPDVTTPETLQQDLSSEYLLAGMSTYLGIVRMELYYFMLRGDKTDVGYEDMENHYNMYQALLSEYEDVSTTFLRKRFSKIEHNTTYSATIKLISDVLREKRINTTLKADEWWNTSSHAVDLLKELQHQTSASISKDANTVARRERLRRDEYVVILILIILVVIAIVWLTIRSITGSLNILRDAAGKISKGMTGIDPGIQSKDAIGSLAASFVEVDRTSQQLALAADNIGKGNFHISVKPRSEEDVLGNAIVHMAADLEVFRKNDERKIWVQTGLNRVSEILLGEKHLSSLTNDALTTVMQYTGAQTGVLYLNETDGLHFSAGYALPIEHPAPEKIPAGKTLLGQAAQQQEIIRLEGTPDGFLHVGGGITSGKPGYVLVIPLIHAGITEGVIEMGALFPLGDNVIEYTKQAAVHIAIAIQSTRSRSRLQELLEETQAQAEELQVQHSELESLNVELEAQTQKLQVSEEELKVQQEELMQSNTELEERARLLEDKNQVILDRNLEIRRKADELAASTRYKSEFLANMSHELRTPLNSILLLSRLLAENAEQNLSNDQQEYAKVINNSGKGLLTLIDEILDLSKVESGKMELEYEKVSIPNIVSNMQELFEPVAKDKGLSLLQEIEPGTPAVIETDQNRLEQVLKNMLSNALKFTSRGAVTLKVQHGNTPGTIRFVVKDTGIGIPEDKQQVIFEAFQQADGSTRRKYGGTGLGLSISRELARLLGGSIQLTSRVNEGSEFSITIPATRGEIVRDPATTQPERVPVATPDVSYLSTIIPAELNDDRNEIRRGDEAILIVEDDTYFAATLLNFTRQRGYKGIVSVRGDLAGDLARKYRPVAILLDIQLPVKDGWQVMEELKSDPATKSIPVHIMSSLEVKKESLIKGAVDFISKPATIENIQLIFEKLEFVLHRATRKVLILEENTRHARALAYFLESYQVNAEISHAAGDTIYLLQQPDVDCVILDMDMSEQEAPETLEKVKSVKGLENLPVIIFTGKTLTRPEEQRLRQYADSIVVKTAHSYQRILDEVSLFLHLVSEQAVAAQNGNGKMAMLNEVLKDKTVLLADDDVRNIYSLTRALEKHQMKVLPATDGNEALQQLKENPVDIVLMDMMMPEMDGYDAIAAIRAQPQLAQLPVIAVTARAMTGDREKCLLAGASDYISKPVDVDQLLSLLRVWLYDKSMKM
ncbi:MAG TPA: response regulator [Chitinophaga sp.]|uniref:response regulator n=1 Tax=Chitinophaga sp. TaxID=1869181 RepID=UPI002BB9AF09|nr:response regulator [Chitinophaga sp.]HVI46980.1 response regulator [Chitinophaga sp.]